MSALCAALLIVSSAEGQTPVEEAKTILLPAGPGQTPFNVTRHTIPISEIGSSVPRDSIPALANPSVVSASQVKNLLRDSDRVLAVLLNGQAKAYPIRILNWHELVNDDVGGRPVLVSW